MQMLDGPKVSSPTTETSSENTSTSTKPSETELAEKYGRERGGYEYYDAQLRYVHATSIPATDEEAVEYFATVAGWTPQVRYVAGHPHTSLQYEFLPFTYRDGIVEEGVNP